jgi:hypothetical protein
MASKQSVGRRFTETPVNLPDAERAVLVAYAVRQALFGPSLDHLVGAGEEGLRHGQSERLGGFEINDQRELRWLLNRKVRRAGALEDAVDVRCRLRV